MTGAAVDGRYGGPPGRLGLAWLLDTVAKLGARPVEQIDIRADNGSVTGDPDGPEAVFASRVYLPPAWRRAGQPGPGVADPAGSGSRSRPGASPPAASWCVSRSSRETRPGC